MCTTHTTSTRKQNVKRSVQEVGEFTVCSNGINAFDYLITINVLLLQIERPSFLKYILKCDLSWNDFKSVLNH